MSAPASTRMLFGLVAMGLALRVALVLLAEHGLDADESVVGLMALDILEKGVRPLFFYGTAYNGGGAFEAYLVAGAFTLFGASALAIKLSLLGLWLPAGVLFANLCRRTLPSGSLIAVAFFCLGTPFFLEWSVKARGGFAETLLFSVALLWLAAPSRRRALAGLAFGVLSGLGLWASEMLLPLMACAGPWVLGASRRGERGRVALALMAGLALGVLPLLLVNLGHDWIHLRQSSLYAVLWGERRAPLSASDFLHSWEFVLGTAWPILALGVAVGAARSVAGGARAAPGLVALAQLAVYALGFWLGGLRNIYPAPPSRVLYALQPSLALLLGYASSARPGASAWGRRIAGAAAGVWLVLTLAQVGGWAASAAPRETGSWRSRWSLVDGPALRARLVEDRVELAYASLWTASALELADRMARRADPGAPHLEVDYRLPRDPPPAGRRAAIVLPDGSKEARRAERRLRKKKLDFQRSEWRGYLVIDGIDASRVSQRAGFPASFIEDVFPPWPGHFEGFN